MTNPEILLPVIRDQDGTELSSDEMLSRWLLEGRAREIPAVSEVQLDRHFGDAEIAFLGPGHADGGRRQYEANEALMFFDRQPSEDRELVIRHLFRKATFGELASERGVTRQAVQRKYERILDRVRKHAANRPPLTQEDLDRFDLRAYGDDDAEPAAA